MAWVKGYVKIRNTNNFIQYCINIDDIRNFTYEDSCYKDVNQGVFKAWFKGVDSYQEISENDYIKITTYLTKVAKSPDEQLPSDALLI